MYAFLWQLFIYINNWVCNYSEVGLSLFILGRCYQPALIYFKVSSIFCKLLLFLPSCFVWMVLYFESLLVKENIQPDWKPIDYQFVFWKWLHLTFYLNLIWILVSASSYLWFLLGPKISSLILGIQILVFLGFLI